MNKAMLAIVGVIVALVVMLALFIIPKYNSLVSGDENVDGKWAQVETELQRRFDLIPNLVESVKGYAAHEEEILGELAEARTNYGGANSVEQNAEANEELSGALSRLLVIVENYPDLKADANFRQLMDELAGTENRLAVAREVYNDAAQSFNSDVRRFPGNIIASLFGFEKRQYFEAAAGAQNAPQVDFNTDDDNS